MPTDYNQEAVRDLLQPISADKVTDSDVYQAVCFSYGAILLEQDTEFDGAVLQSAGLEVREGLTEKAIALIIWERTRSQVFVLESAFRNEQVHCLLINQEGMTNTEYRYWTDLRIGWEWWLRHASYYLRDRGWEPFAVDGGPYWAEACEAYERRKAKVNGSLLRQTSRASYISRRTGRGACQGVSAEACMAARSFAAYSKAAWHAASRRGGSAGATR